MWQWSLRLLSKEVSKYQTKDYNESRYVRPYVTRKYWDGMIEGTIVGIGKDGAK